MQDANTFGRLADVTRDTIIDHQMAQRILLGQVRARDEQASALGSTFGNVLGNCAIRT